MSTQPPSDCLEHFPGVALELSADGIVRRSNGRLDALVGRELVGLALADVLDSSSQPKWRRILSETQRVEPACTWELVVTTPASLELRTFLAIWGGTAPAATLWLLEYAVDPKLERIYGELTGMHRDLVEAQRKLGRETRRLARALETARKAVRTRDEVLAIVSHDLRSPLGTIAMAADLIEMPIPAEKKTEQIAIIRRSIESMTRLISDLLDVGAMEGGRFAVELQPVSIGPLLEEACRTFAAKAAQKDLRFDSSIPPELPEIEADRHRLRQVLSNLVGNALKFTPAGGAITVRAAADGGEVIVAVEDTGPGIAASDLPHIFDWFWHASRRHRGGSGLGLAIAKGIVEAHGGRINVESSPGSGSTFGFALPASATRT